MLFQRRIWATRIIKKAGIPILPKKGRVLINLLIATAKQAPKETSPAKATLVAALSVAQSKAAAASPLALQNALAELPQAAIEVAKEYGMTDFAEWAENDQRVFKACQLGSNAAESVNAEIEAYMKERFYPNVSKMVDEIILGGLYIHDMPPLVAARMDLKVFIEGLDDSLRSRVIPRVQIQMAGWLKVFKQMAMEGDLERLIEHHFNQFKDHVALTAFCRMIELADTIKEADDKWRAANPEKAAQMSVNYLGDELADVMAPYLKRG